MKVLVCGDRKWTDKSLVRMVLSVVIAINGAKVTVIEGEAAGADTLGREVAEELDCEVLKFPARWSEYGRAAGSIRNKQMLDEGHPDLVLAFHDDLDKSKGTRDMVGRARKALIPTWVSTMGEVALAQAIKKAMAKELRLFQ